MTTKFFTNKNKNSLINKFEGVFTRQNIQHFDALVAYFRASIIRKTKSLFYVLFIPSFQTPHHTPVSPRTYWACGRFAHRSPFFIVLNRSFLFLAFFCPFSDPQLSPQTFGQLFFRACLYRCSGVFCAFWVVVCVLFGRVFLTVGLLYYGRLALFGLFRPFYIILMAVKWRFTL